MAFICARFFARDTSEADGMSQTEQPRAAERLKVQGDQGTIRREGTCEIHHCGNCSVDYGAHASAGAENEPAKRLNDAATVFAEIMDTPDKGIPQDLLEKSHCIVIVPDLKTAAFIGGGKYGKGYLVCRSTAHTGWSAPGTVRIEGGSVGFQIGDGVITRASWRMPSGWRHHRQRTHVATAGPFQIV
jgi:hypothetical protein